MTVNFECSFHKCDVVDYGLVCHNFDCLCHNYVFTKARLFYVKKTCYFLRSSRMNR